MKRIIFLVLCTTLIAASTTYSKSSGDFVSGNTIAAELPIASDEGSPKIGITYAYDRDWMWQITYVSKLTADDISALPDQIVWNISVSAENGSSSQLLPASIEISKKMLQVGQLKISSPLSVKKILLEQKKAYVEFLQPVGGGLYRSLYKITLGVVCYSIPPKVKDLTNTNRPACEVKPEDFPDHTVECKESEYELMQWLKDGLVTCDIAKDVHQQRGCGELVCLL